MPESAASSFDIGSYLSRQRAMVDTALEASLPAAETVPTQLHEAMRYSVLAGGKRLRPILALATAECLECDERAVLDLAAALELIHTYSLIHDDLPAMDDDDYRRGRLTSHRVFGEGIAILAGNALLTLAFRKLATLPGIAPERRLLVQQHLLAAIDSERGLIAGQAIDLLSEGRQIETAELERMHRAKTGALIAAAIGSAARLCNASRDQQENLDEFGRDIGLAFQIVDDILDVEGSQEELGKSTGKDAQSRKATYPARHGLKESRRKAESLIAQASARLDFAGPSGLALKELARFVSVRRS